VPVDIWSVFRASYGCFYVVIVVCMVVIEGL